MPQNIRDVMTSNPCTIDANRSVAYAAKMMQEEDVGLAPIVEGDKLIGMLTDRDIATRVAAEGRNPNQVKVRDVASTQLVTIDPQQDLDDALRMMAKHQVRRLPVVTGDGRLVGVVAQADIARAGDDSKTGQLVEEISESGGQMSSIEEGQFPRQVEDQPVSFVSPEDEPSVLDEQRQEEGVSKVQAASSRGRKRRSTSRKRSTTRKSSGGTRKRKTTSRKKSSTGTRKRKTTSRKRSTGRTTVKTAGRRGGRKAAAKKRSTAKRSTAKRRTTARRSTATRKTSTRRRTTRRKTR
jgi:CBS domain-containing protein